MTSFETEQPLINQFTKGDCWALAIAVNDALGWTICTVQRIEPLYPEDIEWCHALNRRPDGTLVDILGIVSEQEMLARWNAKLVENELGDWTRKDFDEEMDSGYIEQFYEDSPKAAAAWVAANMDKLIG